MTEEIATADAEAVQNSAENTNISVQDLANRRLGQLTQKVQTPTEPEESAQEVEEQPVEEVIEPEEPVSEESESTESEDPVEENVLSQLDLDDMSEDELRELADKLGSRAVARYGELTAKRKAAEEQLAQLQAKLAQDNPLDAKRVQNNPYDNLDTIEKLQEKSEEIENIVEWAEDILFESDGYSADDTVTELDGKEWTKKDVRQALLKARKAQKSYLPDRLKKIQAQIEGDELASSFSKKAQDELDWLSGEDNDTRKQFEATIGDSRFQKLKDLAKKEIPDVAAQLDYWFAHASNSIYGRRPVETKKSSIQLNPSKSAAPSSSQSQKTGSKTAKAIKELEARFKQTGNIRDFAELRKMKMFKT